jgi:hypothetical protein
MVLVTSIHITSFRRVEKTGKEGKYRIHDDPGKGGDYTKEHTLISSSRKLAARANGAEYGRQKQSQQAPDVGLLGS